MTTEHAVDLLAILADPACPWEEDAPGERREVQVDRLLAFAFLKGAELRGLEGRLDALVEGVGGVRRPGGADDPLPRYLVPASALRPPRDVPCSRGRRC